MRVSRQHEVRQGVAKAAHLRAAPHCGSASRQCSVDPAASRQVSADPEMETEMEASALLVTVAPLPLLVSLVFWVWGLRHPCRCCSPRIACRSFSTLVATWDGTVFQDWRACTPGRSDVRGGHTSARISSRKARGPSSRRPRGIARPPAVAGSHAAWPPPSCTTTGRIGCFVHSVAHRRAALAGQRVQAISMALA